MPSASTFRSAARSWARRLVFLAALAGAAPVLAQNASPSEALPVATRTVAIEGARIVQAPGRVVERGTVVLRDGLILAVGTDVAVPYDAERIRGDSLTVYAGFIDALSHAGVPRPEAERGRPAPVRDPGHPSPERAGIQPQRSAHLLLDAGDASLAALRRAGFTLAHSVPYGGMLPGTGALITLAGDDAADLVLRPDVSLFARMQGARGVYPATPMGVMAKLRQLFAEAARRRQAEAVYAADPAGVARPPYDPVHAALYPVLDGTRPVFFFSDGAEGVLDLHHALRLHRELGFPLVLAGLNQAFLALDALRAAGVPLVLTLGLPAEPARAAKADTTRPAESTPTDSARAMAPPPPDGFFDSDLRTHDYRGVAAEASNLEARRALARAHYANTADTLYRAGLRFAFSSIGAEPGDIRANLRAMIAAGLPEDAALAALTVEAARLLGVERQAGTVEPGKLANLVVTKGSYFEPQGHVRYVFVEGRKFEYDAPTKPAGADTAAVAAGAWAAPAQSRVEPGVGPGDLLIRGGTVLTVTNGTLENTDVLVRGGKIARLGRGLQAPAGVPVIDAAGRYVTPGIIDAHSHLAIHGSVNEPTNPVTAEVRIEDVVDPFDIGLYRALAGGVTTAHLLHGSANVIGGQGETVKLRYGETDPAALAFEGAPRTIKFALGENPTRVHGRRGASGGDDEPRKVPATRMGVEFVLRQAFHEAGRYRAAWDAYRAAERRRERAAPPAYDGRMEVLADILRGDVVIHCHSYRADEILMLLDVLRDFGVERVVFQHANEAFKVAPELAAFGAGASVFSDWWAYKFEVYYSTAYNAAILTRNGVLTSINSDSPELIRHLYHEAAKTQRYGGLGDDEALALVTINPARQLGVADRVGSIEPGKDADLVIFDAHPLSVYAVPQQTIVDGVVRFDRTRDPDDMRLLVDPAERIEAPAAHAHAACLDGTDLLDWLNH